MNSSWIVQAISCALVAAFVVWQGATDFLWIPVVWGLVLCFEATRAKEVSKGS